MQVKVEPADSFPGDLDIESHIFREQLFGYPVINSDVSESGSEDDPLSKLSFCYENNADMEFNQSSYHYRPATCSSRSSSTSGGQSDFTHADLEFSSHSLCEYSKDDELEIKMGVCSPTEIMNQNEMEDDAPTANLDADSEQSKSGENSPNHIWDLLCSFDFKPKIESQCDSPRTPPELNIIVGDSPHRSPQSGSSSGTPSPPCTSFVSMMSSSNSPPKKKVALAPKMPFRMVRTISAIEQRSPEPINMIPSSSIPSNPVINLKNSVITPRLSIITSGSCSPKEKESFIPNAVVVTTSPPSFAIDGPTTISIPSASNVSTCGKVGQVMSTKLPPLAPALYSKSKNSQADIQAYKRHQRMIKNRESASLSRKKKKEYVQELEDKVRELDVENAKLRAENERLARRVTSLENQNAIMKSTKFPSKRTSAVFLCFVGFLTLNLLGSPSAFHSNLPRSGVPSSADKARDSVYTFHSRSLLSLSPNDDLTADSQGGLPATQVNQSHVCPVGFNSSKTEMIFDDLVNIFNSNNGTFVPNFKLIREGKLDTGFNTVNSAQFMKKKKTRIHLDEKSSKSKRKDSNREKQKVSSLMKSIKLKNDTYYFVSLCEHQLFAANERNASCGPKLSLLVPTSNTNGEKSMNLMQIDCLVTQTKIVEWKFEDENQATNIRVKRSRKNI